MAMTRGFSLIEVSITILVLTLIATGMVDIFSQGVSMVGELRSRAIAYNLAEEKLEECFVWPPAPSETPAAPVNGFLGFQREVAVTPNYLGRNELARIQATVWWDNGNQSQSFATIKSNY